MEELEDFWSFDNTANGSGAGQAEYQWPMNFSEDNSSLTNTTNPSSQLFPDTELHALVVYGQELPMEESRFTASTAEAEEPSHGPGESPWEMEKQPLLPPDLDMSSALQLINDMTSSNMRTAVDANGMHEGEITKEKTRPALGYLPKDQACAIPSRPLREELIALYFREFHPLCPVVDEWDFTARFCNTQIESVTVSISDIFLFQAVMFAASLHINKEVLQKSSYSTIPEFQTALFDRAKARPTHSFDPVSLYRLCYTLDDLLLAKVALLLSYWSPYNSDPESSTYWVGRAFHHARAVPLGQPDCESGAMSSRRRILWWCCLIRDRLTSLGLRRLYSLREHTQGWELVSEYDFGMEAVYPRYTSVRAKHIMIETFRWLCKLSEIAASITLFLENERFDRQWSDQPKDIEETARALDQVARFAGQLKTWRRQYHEISVNALLIEETGTNKTPVYLLRILSDSFVTALYRPYIHAPPESNSLLVRFQQVALRRIKEASIAVTQHVRDIVSKTHTEDFSQTIYGLAFIAFPMVVFQVAINVGDQAKRDECREHFSTLAACLRDLEPRFLAASFLTVVIQEVTGLIARQAEAGGVSTFDSSNQASRTAWSKTSAAPAQPNNIEEAELLELAASYLDRTMGNHGEATGS